MKNYINSRERRVTRVPRTLKAPWLLAGQENHPSSACSKWFAVCVDQDGKWKVKVRSSNYSNVKYQYENYLTANKFPPTKTIQLEANLFIAKNYANYNSFNDAT